MLPDGFGGLAGHDGGEGFGGGLLDIAQASEVGKEALSCERANAGDVEELGVAVTHGAALAMVADSEPVAFVANELDKVKDG